MFKLINFSKHVSKKGRDRRNKRLVKLWNAQITSVGNIPQVNRVTGNRRQSHEKGVKKASSKGLAVHKQRFSALLEGSLPSTIHNII